MLRLKIGQMNSLMTKAKAPKYKNVKVTLDGLNFDSKAEAARYVELKQMQAGGLISGLQCQETFALAIDGALICKYRADFSYTDGAGQRVVEDVKGVRTQVYLLKKKLMKILLGIAVQEITKGGRRARKP